VSAVSSIRANLLLCDAAQVVGGKLYILGGGWQYVQVPGDAPVGFMVAIDLIVPWDMTNRELNLAVSIATEDGEEVLHPENDQPIRAEGQLVVGRPPTARAGADLHTPIAIPFPQIPLDAGGYVCIVSIDGDKIASTGFQISRLQGNFPTGGQPG
jgi:hypothetical protein